MPESAGRLARAEAVAHARRIFRDPEPIVDALLTSLPLLDAAAASQRDRVVNVCYQRPIRMAATREVLALRIRHWPMLNLLDAAERDRRAFADAMAAAVDAERTLHDASAFRRTDG